MMERKIIGTHGNAIHTECLGCARERGDIGSGSILRTEYFDAHQDYEIPIPGFVIISSRRHLKSVDEFTDEEQSDFIKILCTVRRALRSSLNIQAVYLIQEEDTSHHFHVWLFPRLEWMVPFGRKIQSVRPVMEHAREHLKTPENLKLVEEAVEKIKESLNK
jgi:diadenosine tetraphosphate (Ap4A) HIT family hydrolase